MKVIEHIRKYFTEVMMVSNILIMTGVWMSLMYAIIN